MTKLAVFLPALLPALLSTQPDRFSLPACSGPGRELADRVFFLLCHDASLKVSRWTAHVLERGHSGEDSGAARPHGFQVDSGLAGPVARNADYRSSGYSRGHLVPAGDLAWSGVAVRTTFLLSNAVPQKQAMNSGMWRRLEAAVREISDCSDAVYYLRGRFSATRKSSTSAKGKWRFPRTCSKSFWP